jgi:hypothetical protein
MPLPDRMPIEVVQNGVDIQRCQAGRSREAVRVE